MRSLLAAAFCLSLISSCHGRGVAHNWRDLTVREAEPEPLVRRAIDGLKDWFAGLLARDLETRQSSNSSTCYRDSYYDFVRNMSNGEAWCQSYMHYPNITVVIDYTPTRQARPNIHGTNQS